MAEADRYRTYFDEAWKKVLERFFPKLLRFFLPPWPMALISPEP